MTQVRYCPQCGREVGQEEWNCFLYCNQCGFEYRQLQIINPPPSRVAGCAIQAINNTQRFAQTNPVAFAVTATSVGAAGIFLGPLAIAAGKGVAITGGVMMGLGCLVNEEGEAFIKVSGVVLGSGLAIAGSGYLMTAAGVA